MNLKYIAFAFLISTISSLALNAQITSVVFDLDVLFDYAQTGAMAQGMLSVMGKSVDTIRNQLFDILAKAACPEVPCSNMMYKGKQMPLLWCAYYLDIFTPEQVLKKARDIITKHTGWFGLERKMLHTAAEYAFNPDEEVKMISPNESMFALVRSLIAQGVRVILFTNKNSASWQVFQKYHPQHLELFAQTSFISGIEGVLKPSQEAYAKLIERFGLNPGKTLCIESQEEYLGIVRRFGFRVMHYTQVLSDDSCALLLASQP